MREWWNEELSEGQAWMFQDGKVTKIRPLTMDGIDRHREARRLSEVAAKAMLIALVLGGLAAFFYVGDEARAQAVRTSIANAATAIFAK